MTTKTLEEVKELAKGYDLVRKKFLPIWLRRFSY